MERGEPPPASGAPDDPVPRSGRPADLAGRIVALQAAAAELPRLGHELIRVAVRLDAAREERDRAVAAAAAAMVAYRSQRLPAPRAWWNLATGRYADHREAAACGCAHARAAAAAAETGLQRLTMTAARLAAHVREAQAAQIELGPLLELRRLDELIATGDPRAAQVAEIDHQVAAIGGRLDEVAEAAEAVAAAGAAAEAALDRLSSAHSWGTYDTFFGGGVLAGLIKHDRIDEARAAARAVAEALAQVRVELADVRVDLGDLAPAVPPLSRGLDIWFDDLLSDWSVQGAIRDQQGAVSAVARHLQQLAVRLGQLRGALTQQRDDALAERRRLLSASS